MNNLDFERHVNNYKTADKYRRKIDVDSENSVKGGEDEDYEFSDDDLE